MYSIKEQHRYEEELRDKIFLQLLSDLTALERIYSDEDIINSLYNTADTVLKVRAERYK